MAQLLLELFSEEIPARMQGSGAAALKDLVCKSLKEASLEFDSAAAYSTPRRIALVVEGLPEAQPDISEEKRGPRSDAPETAIEGFLRANNLTLDDCEKREAGKGEFWFATIEQKGRQTADILPEILPEAIRKLPWQKSMRWGSGSLRWVRPLQSILCVLDGTPVTLEIGDGVPCGRETRGHRFYAPDAIEVGFFDDYEKSLQRAKVVLNPETRRTLISEKAEALAADAGYALKPDPALLGEVTGLVEWPVPLLGTIDTEFMELPDEVLTTSMRSHQKYFSVEKEDGTLAPHFVVVSNIDADDGGAAIVAGNERVLRARLSDAKFFWDQDRKQKLEEFLPGLNGMVFHEKLGSLTDKVARLENLAAALAPMMGADAGKSRRAAHLCKADLMTGMVGEFASLQGVMGRYYAMDGGEDTDVADAIAQHYSPAGPDDDCPIAPVSLAVSIADKLDTLVGFFGIDEKPTGSRDPYALRRAALGIIRMVLENGLRMPLSEIIALARREYRAQGQVGASDDPDTTHTLQEVDDDVAMADLVSFFADRLKVHLRSQGVRHDLIDAVFALEDEDDLVRIVSRVEALQEFLGTEDGENLLAAYRRATNIVEIEEKKDGTRFDGFIDLQIPAEHAEESLRRTFAEVSLEVRTAISNEDFTGAMTNMAALRNPIDLFFNQVKVNVQDGATRVNRLNTLAHFRGILGKVADFGRIEG